MFSTYKFCSKVRPNIECRYNETERTITFVEEIKKEATLMDRLLKRKRVFEFEYRTISTVPADMLIELGHQINLATVQRPELLTCHGGCSEQNETFDRLHDRKRALAQRSPGLIGESLESCVWRTY